MKTHYSIVSLLLLTLIMASCSQSSHLISRVPDYYPNSIWPLYVVDTIHINNPRCIEVVDTTTGFIIPQKYIVSANILDTLKECHLEDLKQYKSAIRLLDATVIGDPYVCMAELYNCKSIVNIKGMELYYDNLYFIFDEECTYERSIDSMKVYRFNEEPEAFLISLVLNNVIVCLFDDVFAEDYGSSYEYIPCVTPVFSDKKRRIIELSGLIRPMENEKSRPTKKDRCCDDGFITEGYM